jgi:HEPN domain-containing protein
MADKDEADWLYRLDAGQWLIAAENELRASQRAFVAKQQRAAVAQARRAAGMALNALLRVQEAPDPTYGRTYMDHLHALTRDETAPDEVRQAARRLLEMPLRTDVVALGRGDAGQAAPAAEILAYARRRLAPADA